MFAVLRREDRPAGCLPSRSTTHIAAPGGPRALALLGIGESRAFTARDLSRTIAMACLMLLATCGPAPAATARRALLIAINRYASPNIPALHGPLNDIEMMHKILVTRFGFQESDIRTVTDSAATREGILAALRAIVRESGPDDIIYIHYSGHGSQVVDTNGDETDHLDETIVPYDGRTGDVPDVTDDELAEIIGGFRSTNVFVILDSCHSGSATRSVAVQTRSIPADTRDQLYARPASRSVVQVGSQNHVLMTGASSKQSALDGPIEGLSRGFFSYALGRVLSGAPAGTSLAQIEAGVKVVFSSLQEQFGLTNLPDPQVEGTKEALSRPFLGLTGMAAAEAAPATPAPAGDAGKSGASGHAAAPAERASVEVRSAGPGRVQLVEAVAMGAAPGSRWAIYPKGERAYESGGALATARVDEVRGADALAVTEAAGPAIETGARAILISTAPPANAITVTLNAPANLQEPLKSAVTRRMAAVRFVAPTEFARLLVEVTKGTASDSVSRVNVFGAGGLQQLSSFAWTDADQAADQLVTLFARSASVAAIKSLSNPASRMKLGVKMVTAGSGEAAQRGVSVVPAGNAAKYRIRKPDEARTSQNSLMLEVDSDRDCYLTIVDVDAEGVVTVLFPNAQQGPDFLPGGRLSAGTTARIPDTLSEPNRAGFFWDYSPPAGQDVIQVFATTDLESTQKLRGYIEDFRKQGASGSAGVAGRGLSSQSDPLERMRADLAGLATTRGIKVVTSKPSSPAPPPAGAPAPPPPTAPANDWTSIPLTIEVTQ